MNQNQLNDATEPRSVDQQQACSALPLRDALAVSFFAAIDAAGAGTVAQAAKELGIEVKQYDCDTHWPQLVARRCYAQADAFLAARDMPNVRISDPAP